ncbi:hypothetical protein [Azorhizophilus paspali]|uniref:Uncharacterized protein n=1 Tax=Azorhizophilus paspali TaxID=69963 RepID=A0ABV6SGI9_AZOPA
MHRTTWEEKQDDWAGHERFLIVLSFIAMIEPPDGGFDGALATGGLAGGQWPLAGSLNRPTATGMPDRRQRPPVRTGGWPQGLDAERFIRL